MKRTHSTVSSEALKKFRTPTSTVNDSTQEFNEVLQDLTRYQDVISAIFPTEEDEEKDEEKDEDGNNKEAIVEEVSVIAEINELHTEASLDESILIMVHELIHNTCTVEPL